MQQASLKRVFKKSNTSLVVVLWLTLKAVKSFQVSVFVEIIHTQIGEIDFGPENLVYLARNHISS